MSAPVRILIVKLGAIGDVLMALPAVDALRRSFAPAAVEIDWIAGGPIVPLLTQYSWIHVIPADERAILHGRAPARLRALLSVWRRLHGIYDLAATLYYDPRYRILSLPVRARRRLALSRTDRGFALLPGRHHTDEFARILLGTPDSLRPASLTPLAPDHLVLATIPARPPGRRRIALVPGGAANVLRQQTLRRWPIQNYVALATALLARGYEVLLLGGPDDSWAAEPFTDLAVRNTIAQLSLPEVITAAGTCDVVVSHDTGPLHLAGVTSASIVALFGPTDPGSFLPRRPGVFGIWGGEAFACRPCYDGVHFAPCTSNGCMQQITPAMALAVIDLALATRQAGNPAGPELLWPRTLLPSQLTGDLTRL